MKKIKYFIFGILLSFIVSILLIFLFEEMSGNNFFTANIFSIENIIYLGSYFIWTVSLAVLLEKMNYEHYWLAPVPLVNAFILIDFLDKPPHWLIFLIIPIFNIIISFILLVNLLLTLEKHPATTILFYIPFVNNFYWIYLAITTKRINIEPDSSYSGVTSSYKI